MDASAGGAFLSTAERVLRRGRICPRQGPLAADRGDGEDRKQGGPDGGRGAATARRLPGGEPDRDHAGEPGPGLGRREPGGAPGGVAPARMVAAVRVATGRGYRHRGLRV